jgi:hypothetical protein
LTVAYAILFPLRFRAARKVKKRRMWISCSG